MACFKPLVTLFNGHLKAKTLRPLKWSMRIKKKEGKEREGGGEKKGKEICSFGAAVEKTPRNT